MKVDLRETHFEGMNVNCY